MDCRLREAFELKTEILGSGPKLQKEARVLNRVIQWQEWGISWEADPRQVELVLQDMGLDQGQSSSVVTPRRAREE